MPADLSENILLVISDTAIYRDSNGFYAYEPVLRELESIASLFDKIIWLGSEVNNKANNIVRVDNGKIRCIQLPSVRHKKFNSLFVLAGYASFIFNIAKYISSATHVHTRGPSHPALVGILFSFFSKRKKYWHKYAGNWVATDLPFTYRLQQSLLKKLKNKNCSITVNGKWNNSNNRIFAFENPCMYEKERIAAASIANAKDFSGKLNLVFVGDLTQKKGILELMECIERQNISLLFKELFIVGDGALYNRLKKRISQINNIKVTMTGKLNRTELNEVYSRAHVLILPSYAEGFPKVIAEGAAFGCIPVVTNISSISQYIVDEVSGFLMMDNTPGTIKNTMKRVSDSSQLKQISLNAMTMCNKFTYEYFKERISKEIFVKEIGNG